MRNRFAAKEKKKVKKTEIEKCSQFFFAIGEDEYKGAE